MAQILAYFTFNGNCKNAMEFYQQCFGGDLVLQTIGESPFAEDMPKLFQKTILHAVLTNPQITLMGTDMVSEKGLQKGNTVSLMLHCSSEDELRSLFKKLSAESIEAIPAEDTFYGALFASLTDKFGNHWLLHYQQNKRKTFL